MSMNVLQKKRLSAKIDCSKISKNGEAATSNQDLDNTTDTSKSRNPPEAQAKRYMKELVEINNFLNAVADSNAIKNIEVSKVKEYLNRVTVIVQDWKMVPPEVQEKFKIEDLLPKVVFLAQHESTQLKFRVIRACLFIIQGLGFANYMANGTTSGFASERMDSEASFSRYSEQEETGQQNELFFALKTLARLSKESQNDRLFIQEGLLPFLIEIIATIPDLKQEFPGKITIMLLNILKNISGNEEMRKKSLETKNCAIFSRLLNHLNEMVQDQKKANEEIIEITYQLTACLRNLATDPSCINAYYETGIIIGLGVTIQQNLQETNLVLNCVRILAKLSLNKDCCAKIVERQQNVENFIKMLKLHRNGLAIVIRVTFILANIATYIEKMREYLYFDLNAFPQLIECFNYYLTKGNTSGPQDMDKVMRTSFAKFDKASANENYKDALTKLIRLMANLFTLEQIGKDFVEKDPENFKYLLRNVCVIIKDKEVESNTELLVAGLSFLANTMFFEDQTATKEDFTLRTIKTEILFTLSRFIIQIDNQEVACEALRVLSNLSRDKAAAKKTSQSKVLDAVIALLAHDNKDIVYYSIGIIMNLMLTDEMKKKEVQQTVLNNIVNILFYSTIDDLDIVSCCLKCSTNIIDSLTEVDGNTLKTLEELIVNFGEQCNVVMKTSNSKNDEANDVGDLKGIINHLLNIMPEQVFWCTEKSCGRKFTSEPELRKHLERRHKK